MTPGPDTTHAEGDVSAPTYSQVEQLRDVYCGRTGYGSVEEWLAHVDAALAAVCEGAGLDFAPQSRDGYDRLREANRAAALYFLDEDGAATVIPRGWAYFFPQTDDPEDGPLLFGWTGGTGHVTDWLGRPDKGWRTTDAQGWTPASALARMRRVTEAEARQADPDLFRLMDAVRSGEAT